MEARLHPFIHLETPAACPKATPTAGPRGASPPVHPPRACASPGCRPGLHAGSAVPAPGWCPRRASRWSRPHCRAPLLFSGGEEAETQRVRGSQRRGLPECSRWGRVSTSAPTLQPSRPPGRLRDGVQPGRRRRARPSVQQEQEGHAPCSFPPTSCSCTGTTGRLGWGWAQTPRALRLLGRGKAQPAPGCVWGAWGPATPAQASGRGASRTCPRS